MGYITDDAVCRNLTFIVPIQESGQFRLAISGMCDVNAFFGKPGKCLIYMPRKPLFDAVK
jgi:hypothetical protein